jgi:hypothetical protein
MIKIFRIQKVIVIVLSQCVHKICQHVTITKEFTWVNHICYLHDYIDIAKLKPWSSIEIFKDIILCINDNDKVLKSICQ